MVAAVRLTDQAHSLAVPPFWYVPVDIDDPLLPTRRLNLTELTNVAEAMANEVRGTYKLRVMLEGSSKNDVPWDELEGLTLREKAALAIDAYADEPADLVPAQRMRAMLYLQERPRLNIYAPVADAQRLRQRVLREWMEHGHAVRPRWWVYPAGLITALALASAGVVVATVMGDLSLWLLPLVTLVLLTSTAAGAGWVNTRIQRVMEHGGPLPIDYETYKEARRARAGTWARRRDVLLTTLITSPVAGLIGAGIKSLTE